MQKKDLLQVKVPLWKFTSKSYLGVVNILKFNTVFMSYFDFESLNLTDGLNSRLSCFQIEIFVRYNKMFSCNDVTKERVNDVVFLCSHIFCLSSFLEHQRNRGRGKKSCKLEIRGNETRSGHFSQADLEIGKKKSSCSIIFKGNPGDVVLIKFNSYKLRWVFWRIFFLFVGKMRKETEFPFITIGTGKEGKRMCGKIQMLDLQGCQR